MDIKSCLEELKSRLEKQMESETEERKQAREKMLKELNDFYKQFDVISNKIPTTPEQMNVISQLEKLIFQLGNKGS